MYRRGGNDGGPVDGTPVGKLGLFKIILKGSWRTVGVFEARRGYVEVWFEPARSVRYKRGNMCGEDKYCGLT